jgi:hypothetical protein
VDGRDPFDEVERNVAEMRLRTRQGDYALALDRVLDALLALKSLEDRTSRAATSVKEGIAALLQASGCQTLNVLAQRETGRSFDRMIDLTT